MPKNYDPFRFPDVPPAPVWSVETTATPSNWVIAHDGSLVNLAHVRKVTLHKVSDDVHEVVALDALQRETGPAVVLFRGGFFDAGKSLARIGESLAALDPGEGLPEDDDETGGGF